MNIATTYPDEPDDHDSFGGIIEIDCYECLAPEWKAKFRIGRFVPPHSEGDEIIEEIDCSDDS